MDETVKSGKNVFPGDDAFRLSDTYGFPIDLTKEIVAERGLTVDEEEFGKLMLEQRERARAARKNAGADAWAGENDLLDGVPETDVPRLRNNRSRRKGPWQFSKTASACSPPRRATRL